MDRCRKLYEKYLEFMPENCAAWAKYADLESSLSEVERARAIFELAIQQPVALDMPEVLWKAYIDFEIKHAEFDKTRDLYTRLLERTKHVKVWISRAEFEGSIGQSDNARNIFQQADSFFKQSTTKEERVMLLESWRDFEIKHGDYNTVQQIALKLPRKVKRKRQVKAEDGTELGWEEYIDYIFPDDEDKQSNHKILEMARQWKKRRPAEQQDSSAPTVDT